MQAVWSTNWPILDEASHNSTPKKVLWDYTLSVCGELMNHYCQVDNVSWAPQPNMLMLRWCSEYCDTVSQRLEDNFKTQYCNDILLNAIAYFASIKRFPEGVDVQPNTSW